MKQTARIENWKTVLLKGKRFLVGTFYDHHTIKDGTPGTTSAILSFEPEKGVASSALTDYKLGVRAK